MASVRTSLSWVDQAAKDRAGLEANVVLQHRVGIQTELLSSEALREIMPGFSRYAENQPARRQYEYSIAG